MMTRHPTNQDRIVGKKREKLEERIAARSELRWRKGYDEVKNPPVGRT